MGQLELIAFIDAKEKQKESTTLNSQKWKTLNNSKEPPPKGFDLLPDRFIMWH